MTWDEHLRSLAASYRNIKSTQDIGNTLDAAIDEIDRLRARETELERVQVAAEHLADTVEDYAFTTEKNLDNLRAGWQQYVETVDRKDGA